MIKGMVIAQVMANKERNRMKTNKALHKQYTLARKANQDDEDEVDDDGFMQIKGNHLGYFEQAQVARKITVYLDEYIKEPEYYRPTLHKMHNLGKNDDVEIIVNTYGGRLDSAISIINAIKMTEADVTGVLNNQAHSAGSLILLSCPSIFVAPNSSMMLHSWSSGVFGKSQEIMANVAFNDTQIKKMMAEVYFGFLNDKELEQLFSGVDFWMNSEETVRRLEARNKVLQQMHKKAEQAKKPKPVPKVIPPPEYAPDDVALTPVAKKKKADTPTAELCIECNKPAKWMRSTQFSGEHPYCEQHAKAEKDFGRSDSYSFWYELK